MSSEEFNLEIWIKRFIIFMRSERNASPHTLQAYEKDLKEFQQFLNSHHSNSIKNLVQFRESRLLIREYWVWLSKRKVKTSTLLRKLAVLRS